MSRGSGVPMPQPIPSESARSQRAEAGLHLSCSCGSVVLPVDRVGGPPDLDFTDEGDARLTVRRSPDPWRAVLVSVTSDMSGEVGDQFGALGNIRTPNGMIMKRIRNAGKPAAALARWLRGLGRRQSSTAAMSPAVCSWRPAAAVCSRRSGCPPVSAAKSEQVCSERRPGRFAGEFRDDLAGLAVKHLNELGSDAAALVDDAA
jgi:hypothetical protein